MSQSPGPRPGYGSGGMGGGWDMGFSSPLFRDPERGARSVHGLAAPGPRPGYGSCGMAGDCDMVFSYPMFRDLERGQRSFTGIAAHVVFPVYLAPRGQTPIS